MNKISNFSPVSFGIRQGAKLATLLTVAYTILGIIIEFVRQAIILHELRLFMLPIAHILGIIPIGLLFIFFPAISLGMITGGLIGELWIKTSRLGNGMAFSLMAFFLCMVIVFAIHFVFGIQVDFTIPNFPKEGLEWALDGVGMLGSYPYLIGGPSIIYAVSGFLGSHFYWKKFVSLRLLHFE